MKKCLSLLLAALMMASVLAGCGGDPSTEDTDATADTGTEQAAQTDWNVRFRYRHRHGAEVLAPAATRAPTTASAPCWPRPSPPAAPAPRSPPWSATAPRTTSSRWSMNTAQLGFVQSDVMSYAYNGEQPV